MSHRIEKVEIFKARVLKKRGHTHSSLPSAAQKGVPELRQRFEFQEEDSSPFTLHFRANRESGLVRKDTNTLLGNQLSDLGPKCLEELPETTWQVSGACWRPWGATAALVQVWELPACGKLSLGAATATRRNGCWLD